ncbi:MAG: tRNA (guanosine(46)-N7)-methyltransferase TrmB [Clostridia bacterium]|nr:tRNA (guanosine(46)-N7)-methyltransferase TrmB [Clostridia bacterium]
MRIRRKPNLIPRMEQCSYVQIMDPAALKGEWLEQNPNYSALWLELGCGKGRFTADTAEQNPEALLVAIEKVADAMIIGMERVSDRGIENVRFIDTDVLALPVIFAQGEVDRIYLNFSDPWPKNRDAKHRLTSPGFLELYETVLKPKGEIHFKTDNQPLFEYSVETFEHEGWTLTEVTRNLHENGVVGVMTDYEAKFHEQGMNINRLVAKKEKR